MTYVDGKQVVEDAANARLCCSQDYQAAGYVETPCQMARRYVSEFDSRYGAMSR